MVNLSIRENNSSVPYISNRNGSNRSSTFHTYFTKVSQKTHRHRFPSPLKPMIGWTSFLVLIFRTRRREKAKSPPLFHHPKRCQRCRIVSPQPPLCQRGHSSQKCNARTRSMLRSETRLRKVGGGRARGFERGFSTRCLEGGRVGGFSSRFPGTVEEKKKHRGRRRRWEPSRNL